MRNIRWKKDINVTWTITTDGKPESLEGRDISVELTDSIGNVSYVKTVLKSNQILFTFLGTEQVRIGTYMVTAWENRGKEGQNVVDKREAFRLVRYTDEEQGAGDSDLKTETIDLGTSDFQTSSISIEVVQETGNSKEAVMSQDAVTRELDKKKKRIDVSGNNYLIKQETGEGMDINGAIQWLRSNVEYYDIRNGFTVTFPDLATAGTKTATYRYIGPNGNNPEDADFLNEYNFERVDKQIESINLSQDGSQYWFLDEALVALREKIGANTEINTGFEISYLNSNNLPEKYIYTNKGNGMEDWESWTKITTEYDMKTPAYTYFNEIDGVVNLTGGAEPNALYLISRTNLKTLHVDELRQRYDGKFIYEYFFQISSMCPVTLDFPQYVKFIGGKPTLEPNRTYLIHIFNDIARVDFVEGYTKVERSINNEEN